jgi:hypothetical protein
MSARARSDYLAPASQNRRVGGVRHEQFTNTTGSEMREHRRCNDASVSLCCQQRAAQQRASAMKAKRASEHTGTYLLEPGSREERAYLGLDRDVGSLINDALKIIRPPAAQEVQCHRSIVYSIRGVIDAARVVSSKKQRDKLVVVAQSLPKIHREIEKNRAYLLLPVSPISFPADQVQKWRQEYEIQQKDLGRRRLLLESFLKELDQSAEGVDQLSKDAKPRRSGGGEEGLSETRSGVECVYSITWIQRKAAVSYHKWGVPETRGHSIPSGNWESC